MTAVSDTVSISRAERRIEYLTIFLGAAAALFACLIWGGHAALAVAFGAVLSWLNYRWVRAGVNAVSDLAREQRRAEKVILPRRAYLKFIGRYAVLILSAYAILNCFALPLAGILAGFFAAVAATLAEAIMQIIRRGPTPRAQA
jgi:hypothetical protein